MVALAERRVTLLARNLNQVAAAGPKTTGIVNFFLLFPPPPKKGRCFWGTAGAGRGAALFEKGPRGSLTTTVEGHAASAGNVVLLDAFLLDSLLGDEVAGAKEDGGGDGLGEEGPGSQSGLIPVSFGLAKGIASSMES